MLCPDAPSVRQKVVEHHFDAYVSKLPDTEFTAPTPTATTAGAADGASETRPLPAGGEREKEDEEEEDGGAQPPPSPPDAGSAPGPSCAAAPTALGGEPLLGFCCSPEEIAGGSGERLVLSRVSPSPRDDVCVFIGLFRHPTTVASQPDEEIQSPAKACLGYSPIGNSRSRSHSHSHSHSRSSSVPPLQTLGMARRALPLFPPLLLMRRRGRW